MRRNLLLAACAAVLLFSCTREEQPLTHPATADPAPEEVYTLVAGFEGSEPAEDPTRTVLSLDDAASKASVLWTAGDSFSMVGGGYITTYTTTQSGPYVTFTTRSSVGTPCYRSRQTAVPGGVENGLNMAVAYSATQTADLTFHNVLSYIRFRISGDAVSSVKSVTFDAGTTVAGDMTVTGIPSGNPGSHFNVNWSPAKQERASKIVLTGDFVAGVDYLMALAPCTVNGFNMLFEDAEGHRIRRHSDKSITFQRSRILDFGTIGIGRSR